MAAFGLNESSASLPADINSVSQRIKEGLTEAAIRCSERCLYQSAKWAAELLDALPEDEFPDQDSRMTGSDNPANSFNIFSTTYDDPEEAALEAKEARKFLLAKTYFDAKEFDRCASVFLPPAIPAGGLAIHEKTRTKSSGSTPSRNNKSKQGDMEQLPQLSQKSLFLALYARYMAGEKRKEEDSEMVLGPSDGGQSMNRELPQLSRALECFFQIRDAADPELGRSQGWLEYLYAIVLLRSKQEKLAIQWLLRSIRLNPYHWGAWEELSAQLSSIDDLNAQLSSNALPQSVMTLIYQVYASIDLFGTTDSAVTQNILDELLRLFPTSTFLHTLQALTQYHAKDFDSAAAVFQSILTTEPYRLDALDHYSNILYVMGDRPKLAFLAHLATSVDKFRPETCCVVGNYYSLCSQHEKAVMYFRRALTLDRSFLSAWTLMGHEYVELKNTHAAIESYRRAVDVNRKDYRAWYGLGQAYELLDMGFYALYYYQRAAGLRPYDTKMWQAVGSCYAKMERHEQAIKALKRALAASTYFEAVDSPAQSFSASTNSVRAKGKHNTGRKLLDPEMLWQIAKLYEQTGDEPEAARYMELCIAQEMGGTTEKPPENTALKKARHTTRGTNKLPSSQRSEHAAEDKDNDNDTEVMSSSSDNDTERIASFGDDNTAAADDGFGTGTTATTSRARLWLARYAFKVEDFERAEQLAEELCMDGFEVEEAKGLVREVRGRREAEGGGIVNAQNG